MKKIIIAATALLLLTGCGMTLEEAAAEKDKCHELGGTVYSYHDGGGYYITCDFDDDKENR